MGLGFREGVSLRHKNPRLGSWGTFWHNVSYLKEALWDGIDVLMV